MSVCVCVFGCVVCVWKHGHTGPSPVNAMLWVEPQLMRTTRGPRRARSMDSASTRRGGRDDMRRRSLTTDGDAGESRLLADLSLIVCNEND